MASTSQTIPPPTPQVVIKTETTISAKSTVAPQHKQPRIKREEGAYGDAYEMGDMNDDMDRVDLSQLNLPGGPISSSRTPDKRARGWKKIELWIEQDDPEEIMLDEEDEQSPEARPAGVNVKVEDERMKDVETEEMIVEVPLVVDSIDDDSIARMEKRRRKLRRKAMKGKSREEKEEMAREEVDFEAMRSTFLDPDATQVPPSSLR